MANFNSNWSFVTDWSHGGSMPNMPAAVLIKAVSVALAGGGTCPQRLRPLLTHESLQCLRLDNSELCVALLKRCIDIAPPSSSDATTKKAGLLSTWKETREGEGHLRLQYFLERLCASVHMKAFFKQPLCTLSTWGGLPVILSAYRDLVKTKVIQLTGACSDEAGVVLLY
jgi:hypothetical protein